MFHLTNRERNNRIYAAEKNPIIKKESYKYSPSSQIKDRTDMTLKRPMRSRVQQIFLGRYYTCHNFGHMPRDCKLRKDVSIEGQDQNKEWKKMKDQRFLNHKRRFYGYCHCYHKFGYKDDDCRIKEEDEGMISKEDTNISNRKRHILCFICHNIGHLARPCKNTTH